MNKILEKIKARGYWKVNIRPNKFQENLIESPAKCKEIIQEVQVRLRGWYYPYFSYNNPPINKLEYIEMSNEWSFFLEYWRYYQSGQFIQYFGMLEDWQDQAESGRWTIPDNSLAVISTLYSITEIYEFASRLANKGLLGNECTINIDLHKTMDRQLASLDRMRYLSDAYKCSIENVPSERSYKTNDLIANSSEFSLEHTIWLFVRFNWDHVPRIVLKDEQEKFLKRAI